MSHSKLNISFLGKGIKHKIFITITAKHEIINSFTRINCHIISNGGIERANRYIKTIISQAYGYNNFSRLRNSIMYI